MTMVETSRSAAVAPCSRPMTRILAGRFDAWLSLCLLRSCFFWQVDSESPVSGTSLDLCDLFETQGDCPRDFAFLMEDCHFES